MFILNDSIDNLERAFTLKLTLSENLGGPSVVPVEHARPMRSECLRRCPSDCPTNTIELMEANCKPSCRKGDFQI